MTGTRLDVSGVPVQGAYVARQCPVRAHNDHTPEVSAWRASPSEEDRLRMDAGTRFESGVLASLVQDNPGAVVQLVAVDPDQRAELTLQAMASGTDIILGSRIVDARGRRVGHPDVLVRASGGRPGSGFWPYWPIDIKHHRCLEDRSKTGPPTLVSTLDDPRPCSGQVLDDQQLRRHRNDALQLAHYLRILRGLGAVAPADAMAGVIGKELVVAWHRLDLPMWRTPSSEATTKLRSTLEIYDFEFDFRLDIIARALQRAEDPSLPPLVVPVRIGECETCPWNPYCSTRLEEEDDLSLLPRVGWKERKMHLAHAVSNRHQLAGLDWRTASLVAERIDVSALIADAKVHPGTPVAELTPGPSAAQVDRLRAAGVCTVGDISLLCERTASYSDCSPSGLARQIDLARAATTPPHVFRARGVKSVRVPRAAVEIDIDMENNVDNNVYLWGALVTDRSGLSVVQEGYHPFVSWEALTGDRELQLLERFWAWLSSQRALAADAGASVRIYCYNEGAEKARLQTIARGDLRSLVDRLVDSEEWVDLMRVFESQLITGVTSGLKAVASLAGFAWRAPDAGGGRSMVHYAEALSGDSEQARDEARSWLLRYNEDDVRATLALREWMESADLGQVGDLGR